MIDTEILNFDHLGAEKIEFEVGRSNFKKIGIWKFFKHFFGGRYFNFRYPKHFISFLIMSNDIMNIKYLIQIYYLDWRLCFKLKISSQ